MIAPQLPKLIASSWIFGAFPKLKMDDFLKLFFRPEPTLKPLKIHLKYLMSLIITTEDYGVCKL